MSQYKQLSRLATLTTKLESINDELVDAENEFTHSGDMPEFTVLHEHLDNMLEAVGDLEWEITEGLRA